MSIQDEAAIEIRLRDAMDRLATRTGRRLTYGELAAISGVAQATIESLASRKDYNPTLKTIARLCVALECDPSDLMRLRSSRTGQKRRAK